MAFAIENQFVIVNKGHSKRSCECFGSGPDEINVRALFKDETRRENGISDSFDARHASCLHAPSIHQQRIELDPPIGSEEAAASGIKGRIILESDYRSFDCVEGTSSPGEDRESSLEGIANTGFVSRRVARRNCPCAAVNEENRNVRRS
jgi:hypothetical protein